MLRPVLQRIQPEIQTKIDHSSISLWQLCGHNAHSGMVHYVQLFATDCGGCRNCDVQYSLLHTTDTDVLEKERHSCGEWEQLGVLI